MPNLFDSLLEKMEGRKYQDYFSAFCPFDTHKAPALLVYKDGFICLSCHKTGTLQYLSKKIGSHYIPSQRIDTVSRVLPRWRTWEQKYGDLNGIAHQAHKTLKALPHYQTYLKKRKIEEFIDEGYLGFIDGWITFPSFDSKHRVVDIILRSTSSSFGSRYVVSPSVVGTHSLYVPSWTMIEKHELVYVVYGIIDAISLHLAGLPVVTGVTGKSLHPDLLKPLRKNFIVVPDDGEETEAHRLANQLGWRARVKEIDFPDGTKDTDDIRRIFGDTKLLQLLGA